jgi:hypothetical protein
MSLAADGVLRYAAVDPGQMRALLGEYALELIEVGEREPIPGCFWGSPEAGIIAQRVYVRADTPVHSLLHEACHLMVLPVERRHQVHTDASDCQLEEDATCYLQLLLAQRIAGFGLERACADMDAWGYTFRLGSARAWFERDAEDAHEFLVVRALLPIGTLAAAPPLATATGAD